MSNHGCLLEQRGIWTKVRVRCLLFLIRCNDDVRQSNIFLTYSPRSRQDMVHLIMRGNHRFCPQQKPHLGNGVAVPQQKESWSSLILSISILQEGLLWELRTSSCSAFLAYSEKRHSLPSSHHFCINTKQLWLLTMKWYFKKYINGRGCISFSQVARVEPVFLGGAP